MTYCKTKTVEYGFDEAIDRVTAALDDEGFGILSDIDVQAAFAEKLGITDYPRYRLLGACNPPIANDVLTVDMDAGALMPCTVAVYETTDGQVRISAMNPLTVHGAMGRDEVTDQAVDASERINRALEAT